MKQTAHQNQPARGQTPAPARDQTPAPDTIRLKQDGVESKIVFLSSKEELYPILRQADLFVFDRGLKVHSDMANLAHLILPAGEAVKSNAALKEIIDACFSLQLHRKSSLLAMGGGALCDAAAFAASIYMRGIAHRLVPSTLLAMVDAAIGAKTAINVDHYKNMLGTFHPSVEVLVCPALLRSLDPRQMLSGMAEILKAGMLFDQKILVILETLLEQNVDIQNISTDETHSEVLRELIERSIRVKCMVVEQDFHEQGIRSFLNLGHTFGHAIEWNAKKKGLSILHGEAVGLGIRTALVLGNKLGSTDIAYVQRIERLLDALHYPRSYEGLDCDGLMAAMRNDKKKDEQGLRFVLQQGLNRTELQRVESKTVEETLKNMGAQSS